MQDGQYRPAAAPERALDARLLRFRSKRGENANALASDLMAASRYQDAAEVLELARTESEGDDQHLSLMLGRAWFMAGDLDKAQGLLVQTARMQPNSKDVFRWLGALLLKRGDPERALRVLDRALLLDKNDSDIQSLYARASRLVKVAQSVAPAPEATKPAVVGPEAANDESSVVMTLDESMLQPIEEAPAFDEEFEPDAETEFYGSSAASHVEHRMNEWEEEVLTGVKDLPSPPAPLRPVGTGTIRGMPGVSESGRPLPTTPAQVQRRDATDTGALLGQLVREVLDSQRPPPLHKRPSTRPPEDRDDAETSDRITPVNSSALKGNTEKHQEVAAGFAQHGRPASRSDHTDRSFPGVPLPRSEAMAMPPEPSHGEALALEPPASRFELTPSDADAYESTALLDKETTEALRSRTLGDGLETLREKEPPQSAVEHGQRLASWPDVGAMQRSAVPFLASQAMAGGKPSSDPFAQPIDQPLGVERVARRPGRSSRRRRGKSSGMRGWVVLILLVGLGFGGYVGWAHWQNRNQQIITAAVARARSLALRGDAPAMRKAEAELRRALSMSQAYASSGNLLLFVQMQRALEEGFYDVNELRLSVRTLDRRAATPPYRDAARAVLYALAAQAEQSIHYMEKMLGFTANDPALAYVAGRLKQRFGSEDAERYLRRAAEGAQGFVAAELAFVTLFLDRGAVAVAEQIPQRVIEKYPGHLRGTLWSMLIRTRDVKPREHLQQLDRLNGRLRDAAPSDRFLAELIQVRMTAVMDDRRAALAAMDRASAMAIHDPLLIAFLGKWAQRLGALEQAERLITKALANAPVNPLLKRRLVEIQVQQGKATDALEPGQPLSFDDLEGARLRVHAALLAGDTLDLERVSEALDAYVTSDAVESAEIRGLKLRVALAMNKPAHPILEQAKQLAEQLPRGMESVISLVEAGLATQDHEAASRGISLLRRLAPDNAQTHFLHARVYEATGDMQGAEAALRKALELLPGYEPARSSLARILIHSGRWQEAEPLVHGPADSLPTTQRVTLDNTLNRVRVATGLHRFDDARQAFDTLTPEQRKTESARVVAAQLALAQGQLTEGLAEISPLAETPEASAVLLSTYGDLLLASGWMGRAGAAYRSALEKQADLPEALLGQAEVELRAARATTALTLLDRADASLNSRGRPSALLTRAWVLKGRAYLMQVPPNLQSATEVLRRATAQPTAAAESFFWLGEALSTQSAAQAREAYRRYLELEPNGSYTDRAKRALGMTS